MQRKGQREKLKPSGELACVKQGVRQLCLPFVLGMQGGMLRSVFCPPLPCEVDSGQWDGMSCSLLAKWDRQGQKASLKFQEENMQCGVSDSSAERVHVCC